MEKADEFIIEDKKENKIASKQNLMKLQLAEKMLIEDCSIKDNIFLE